MGDYNKPSARAAYLMASNRDNDGAMKGNAFFFPLKHLTVGEGGVTTKSEAIKMKIKEIYKVREEKLKKLSINNYSDYLLSDEWKKIKNKVRDRKSRKWNFCNICGSDKNLDLHHSSYKVIGQENPGNTIKLLCRDCHYELHELSKQNPTWSFYKVCGQMRSIRRKIGLPVFIYVLN